MCRAYVDARVQVHSRPARMRRRSPRASDALALALAPSCSVVPSPILRVARVQSIYGGSNEIMKELISRGITTK